MPKEKIRYCLFCGVKLNPFSNSTFTAHEYDCATKNRESIPDFIKPIVDKIDLHKKKSDAAMRGIKTRRKNAT